MDLRDSWEEEVKREIARIKHKNKALKQARLKRDQQTKTMHKLQCLQMSKQFLKGCYTGTLHALKEKNYWRDTFTDQLTIAYRQHLTQEVEDQSLKYDHAEELVDSMLETQVTLL